MKTFKIIILFALSSLCNINAELNNIDKMSDIIKRIEDFSKKDQCCKTKEHAQACMQTAEFKNLLVESYKLQAKFKTSARVALEQKLYDKYINTPQDAFHDGQDIQDCNIDPSDPMLYDLQVNLEQDVNLTNDEKALAYNMVVNRLMPLHMGYSAVRDETLMSTKFFEKYLQAINDDEKEQIAHNHACELIDSLLTYDDPQVSFKGF